MYDSWFAGWVGPYSPEPEKKSFVPGRYRAVRRVWRTAVAPGLRIVFEIVRPHQVPHGRVVLDVHVVPCKYPRPGCVRIGKPKPIIRERIQYLIVEKLRRLRRVLHQKKNHTKNTRTGKLTNYYLSPITRPIVINIDRNCRPTTVKKTSEI